jgi:hypothetical protein
MADVFDALDGAVNDLDSSVNKLLGGNTTNRDFENNGFIVSPTPGSDRNSFPSNKIPALAKAERKRELIHWFVPEFGVVRMYINPSSISYNHSKLINKERTKGGYTLQYWGENLTPLTIQGTTGSSGVEGINVLYEIYRAEQLAFDPVALTLASNNAAVQGAEQIVSGIGSAVGGLFGGAGGAIGSTVANGLFGIDNVNSQLAPRNIPSLAQYAFAVEMYHQGWVYRGFFESMVVNERAENFLWDYTINFTATQRRGYRTNYFPWHKSPLSPSDTNDTRWDGIPGGMSFGTIK